MTTISVTDTLEDLDGWTDVAAVELLTPDRGRAALVDGRQVALFLLTDGSLHVLDNHDPIARANVLSRGIVGDRDGIAVVASPIYKQCFDLATGRCIDDPDHAVQAHHGRIVEGRVEVRLGHP